MLWYSSEKENAKWISLLFHPLTSIVIHNNLLISSPIVCLKSCYAQFSIQMLSYWDLAVFPIISLYFPSLFSALSFFSFLMFSLLTSSNSTVLIILVKIFCTKRKRFPFSGLVQDFISSQLTFSYCGTVTLTL